MPNLKLREKDNPEERILQAIVSMLIRKGWHVERLTMGVMMHGLPDLYATHKHRGARWIEVKDPSRKGNVFTAAQRAKFPILSGNGSPIWVLTAATEDEYSKLFAKENWFYFLGMHT